MPSSQKLSRQEIIVRLLHQHKELSITELARTLEVSEWTVRRDLAPLEQNRVLERYYGGVRLNDSARSDYFLPPTSEGGDEATSAAKKAIGLAAARLLEPHTQIVLGAGTTTFQVARALQKFNRPYNIVTNALDIAQELAKVPRMQVTCTGGDVHGDYFTLVGPVTERALRAHFFDVAVVGVSGIAVHEGLTVTNQLNAVSLGLMIEHSSRIIIVADGDKFGRVSFAHLAELKEVDTVVTDRAPAEAFRRALDEAKVDLVIP